MRNVQRREFRRAVRRYAAVVEGLERRVAVQNRVPPRRGYMESDLLVNLTSVRVWVGRHCNAGFAFDFQFKGSPGAQYPLSKLLKLRAFWPSHRPKDILDFTAAVHLRHHPTDWPIPVGCTALRFVLRAPKLKILPYIQR